MFVCAFGGSLLGMVIRTALPGHHLSAESKDVVKQGTGLIATMSALILGLLVASAKSSYDTEKGEIVQMSAKVIFLDRMLANYGPQAADARSALRKRVSAAIDQMWPQERSQTSRLDPLASRGDELFVVIQQLSPENDSQRLLKSQAIGAVTDLGQMRWLLFEQMGRSISTTFLAVVMFWSTVIFISFGLFAPWNSTVLFTLFLCAVSISGAIFLILELDHPFDGVIQISSAPMRTAVEHVGK
jgi:hypothetical protein